MAGAPPPYPPPFQPNDPQAWKYQRRMLRDQAKAQREQIKAQRDQYRYRMQAMRRSSILGPVLLIFIGLVFLLVQTGHLRHERLWDLYGRFWPLLLVLGGAVLLIEWAVDRLLPRDPNVPYLRRRAGGGVVALVIFLAIGGAVLSGTRDHRDFLMHNFSINPDDMAEFLGSKHESDQTLDQAFPPGGSLTIDNPHGDITVNGTSTDGQVHLTLHKQVYSSSDDDAETKASEIRPQIETSGKQLSIAIPSRSGATADLTVTVPATAALTINANHGDVNVSGIHAAVNVTANHGDMTLSEIGGPVVAHGNHNGSSFSAHRIAGPVTVEGHAQDLTLSDIAGLASLSGDFYGDIHLEHLTQGLKFHTSRTDLALARLDGEMEFSSENISADQVAGPFVLTTHNRNINLDRVSGELSVTNRNGTVDLTSAPPLGNVTVQNRNGSVTLTLPDHANFAVNAETKDGELQNDFSLAAREENDRKTLIGTVGKGGSLVRIDTSQGDVAIRKATVAALSPHPPERPERPERPEQPERPESPQVSIQGADGSSVYIGKDGVRILSGADGSSVVAGKNGLKITSRPDGSSVYKAKDGTELKEAADGGKVYANPSGTRLTRSADGGLVYSSRNGTHYTKGADGSVIYQGSDGAKIAVQADGGRSAVAANGRPLAESQIQERLRRAEDEVRRAEEEIRRIEGQRDAERRQHPVGKTF